MNDDITTALLAVSDRFSDKLGSLNLLTEAANEIMSLRVLLESARCEVCIKQAFVQYDELPTTEEIRIRARQIARERGWDCFKEKP